MLTFLAKLLSTTTRARRDTSTLRELAVLDRVPRLNNVRFTVGRLTGNYDAVSITSSNGLESIAAVVEQAKERISRPVVNQRRKAVDRGVGDDNSAITTTPGDGDQEVTPLPVTVAKQAAAQALLATSSLPPVPVVVTKAIFGFGDVKWRISDPFGSPRAKGPHAGVDVAVPKGTPIIAGQTLTVKAHAFHKFNGHYIDVILTGHSGMYRIIHLDRQGVSGIYQPGAVIGYVGNTGASRGPHAHIARSLSGAVGSFKAKVDFQD